MRAVFGILLVVGVGITVGMLLAPDKGRKLRKQLMKKGYKYQKAIKDMVETGREELDKITEDIAKFTEKERRKAKNMIRL